MIDSLHRFLCKFSLLIFSGILFGCLGFEETIPGTEIPPAPEIPIATGTAEENGRDDNQTDVESKPDDEGFPTPENTAEPPTETPEPTANLSTTVELPTPTIQPISVPAVQPLDVNNLPPTNHDLAYISAGSLLLWTHQNRQISPLFVPEASSDRFPTGTFAEVSLVDFSADGNRAAVAVRYDLPLEEEAEGDGSGDSESVSETELVGESEFDIFFIDVVSKEAWLLVSGIEDQVNQLTISPNQAHIVFSTVQERTDDEENVTQGSLFRINTPAGGLSDVVRIAACKGECTQIKWRQDSDLYFFADQRGSYFGNANSLQAEILVENLDTTSGQGVHQYTPIAWSPNGRAVLMIEGLQEGSQFVVFDLPSKNIIPIPDSNWYFNSPPTLIWLADSRIASATSAINGSDASLNTYRIEFDDGLIIQDETFSFSLPETISGFHQLQDGRFVIALQHETNPNAAGLYKLTSFSEQPERINGLPIGTVRFSTLWPEDGSTAVLMGVSRYVAAADGNLYQFAQAVSQTSWLPPSNAQR